MGLKKINTLLPFVTITIIYFIVGFLTTINEQLQAPLKLTYLSEAGSLKNTLTTLISFFFFLGYLINSSLGSRWVNHIGYKKTILRGLGFIISGLLMYWISSWIGSTYPSSGIFISDAMIPYGFLVFLIGSFLIGTSAAVIQVVVNPYIASYDLPGTKAVQRLNITTAINSIGTTSAPFFVTVVLFSGINIENIEIKQLLTPISILIICVIAIIIITNKLHIPDIPNTRTIKGEKLERSIWSFRHFALGVITIFFYVGTEVAIGANLNLHAFELAAKGQPVTFFGKTELVIGGLDLGIHALLSTLYWGGFLVGRATSSFLGNVSAKTQLITTSIVAASLAILATITQNLWFLVSIGLFHSSMWSSIYSLSIKGLDKYTTKASGAFVSAVFGGAVFTLLQGGLADLLGSWHWSWLLCVTCEILILLYAIFGSHPRESDILS